MVDVVLGVVGYASTENDGHRGPLFESLFLARFVQELGHTAGFWIVLWTFVAFWTKASIDPDKVERNRIL
jgi:hypothetical protein